LVVGKDLPDEGWNMAVEGTNRLRKAGGSMTRFVMASIVVLLVNWPVLAQ